MIASGSPLDCKWVSESFGRTITVLNPATEEPIGTVAHADRSDLDEAMAAAAKGFKVWRAIASFECAKVMRKAASGHGSEGSTEAMEAYLNTKFIT